MDTLNICWTKPFHPSLVLAFIFLTIFIFCAFTIVREAFIISLLMVWYPHQACNHEFFRAWEVSWNKGTSMMMMMMMMMMNCFCEMVNRPKAFSLVSNRGHCQRFLPLQISNTPRAGFEPAQNLSPDFLNGVV